MKRIQIFALLFLIFIISSCTKTYQCECTSTPPSGSVSSNTSTVKSTKNDAETYCKDREKQYLYTTCVLK